MRRTGVYRAFDADGRLLYVGSSVDVDVRMVQHGRDRPHWWMFHSRIEVEDFDDIAEARTAEMRAVATEFPHWNVTGRSIDHPDGFGVTFASMPWLADEIQQADEMRRRPRRVLTDAP